MSEEVVVEEGTAKKKRVGTKWNLVLASECIRRNGGTVGNESIKCGLPGIKVLGAIDYLVHYHKYRWVRA